MKTWTDQLVFFDIDGTLLDTHGEGREAFICGLEQVTGTPDDLSYVSFAGNTDRKVLGEVLARRRMPWEEAAVPPLFECIAEALRKRLAHRPGTPVRGAGALVARLRSLGAGLGLVTGNIRACAYLKLASVGLDGFFPFGGFGDAHAERADILREALKAAEATGWRVKADGVCLIGDTPYDVAAGQAVGVPVLGVASGRYTAFDLRKAGAAWAAEDFEQMEEWLRRIWKPNG
ncbi:MAG: HAD hydrolase-like protein [Verrucomicrobiota bacterium]|jgi:phosphoglycolate phosphatase-like HAD superfamily hydrolase|nr:HAD hydrolase-like protein [Verrucomicrobiota bacterium]